MIRLEPKVKSTGLKRTPLKRKLPKVRTAKPRILRSRELPNPPKKRSGLKPMSKKMQIQRRQEDKLSLKLAELSENRCEICGKTYNLHKHEIIKRSHQGDECDPLNCLLLCMNCHDHRKYPTWGTPLSIDEQLKLAAKLHENIT
jgi:hypothetical protein